MAANTPPACRNLVIYEIYVRNHGPHGTFADVQADLPRIQQMGVDVVWLMPIHPIGQAHKKGRLGCPYSIADYREVNPDYGTHQDFLHLVEQAHALGLKMMIDVVFNHTSHDSLLVREHPEYFHRDQDGKPVTTVPDWTDVVDLQHPNARLSAYLIETLKGWVRAGVDGFRCDVASLIPLDFWLEARAEVERLKPGVIWLAESVHAGFLEERRRRGLFGLSDGELLTAFDLAYDYDIWPLWQLAVRGEVPVQRYLEMLRFQEALYPANAIKMRCVENHDQARILKIAPGISQGLAWTAFAAFNKGAFLINAGQESGATHTPTLFDVDKIAWGDYPLQPYLTSLARLKKEPAQVNGSFLLLASEPAIQAAWENPGDSLYGVFNVSGSRGKAAVHLPDGEYAELLNGRPVIVQGGEIELPESAAILRYPIPQHFQPLSCELLDYDFKPS